MVGAMTDGSSAASNETKGALPAGPVLITGASGFIGGRLRDRWLARGADVVSIRRPGSPPSRKGRSVELDYADRSGLEAFIAREKPALVYHVAGVTKGVTYRDFTDGNVMPTENLLRALEASHPGVSRFVLVSSLAAYGPSTIARPLRESDERRPIEFYGKSKREAEEVVESRKGKIAFSIVRPSGVYGPGDADYFALFQQVARGVDVYFGNRQRWFSAIYVDDVLDALDVVSTHDGARDEGFFIDDGVPVTWERFQRTIVEVSGKRVLTIDLPERLVPIAATLGEFATRIDKKPRLFNHQKAEMGRQDAWTSTSEKLRALGWSSNVPVERGVRDTWNWYKRERWI